MTQISLCNAIPFGSPSGQAPDWVHLLPAGEIRTMDGRGPYRVASMKAVAALLPPSGKLPIDENHSIDIAARQGQPSPARGWIVALDARADGLWGKVEWTREGQKLMAEKAYIGISPAILHDKSGAVMQILRASLTNTPNIKGLTSMHSTQRVELSETDHFIMSMFSMSEDDYRTRLAAEQGKALALHAARSGFDENDRKIMSLFQLDEEQYREGLAAAGLAKFS